MKGGAIIAAFILIVVGTAIVAGFLSYISRQSFMTRDLNNSIKALYIAEAGLGHALGKINKYIEDNPNILPDVTDIEVPVTVFGGGTYEVSAVQDETDETVYILTATGTYNERERIIQQNVKVVSINDFAIFSSSAPTAAGNIAGEGQIRGTVYVLGEQSFIDSDGNGIFNSGVDVDINGNVITDLGHLANNEIAIDAYGNFYIGNNYETVPGNAPIPSEFLSRIPPIIEGEIETLNAWLNVKYGQVSLSGSAIIGKEEEVEGVKEYMDVVNVPDGFIPASAPEEGKVYADWVLYNRDLFGDKLRLPNLRDTYTGPLDGVVYPYTGPANECGRLAYYKANGLRVSVGPDGDPETFDIPAGPITPRSNFTSPVGALPNSFSIDGNGTMTIQGRVYINGDLTFNRSTGGGPPMDTIEYNGKGVIVTTGDLSVNVNLYTQAEGPSAYPTQNAIGFMTPNDIDLGGAPGVSQAEMMAFFYAGDTIETANNISVAGSLMARELTLGQNSSVFHVKGIPPEDMINIPPFLAVYIWHEVFGEEE